ncbi:MAG: CPBP family intramembrane metalloprotease [Anaerolineae bacterium]|nr:CPBP family intramembrane metalloprotease [Anaerolineae bacterium]MCO5191743.1 CPBP family intramembrane metalloprotease [Anaerolineae bacterium]
MMFNWLLCILLIAISIPGTLVVLPRTMRSLQPTIEKNLKPGQPMPSARALLLISLLQAVALVAIAAVIGTLLTPEVGLSAPFFEAVTAGDWSVAWSSLLAQLPMSLWIGVGGALVFLVIYYRVFRPKMDPFNVELTEKMRSELGLAGRILYGGIYEEVLTRWGLMTLCVWLISLIIGLNTASLWLGIFVSGVLFGLGHLPGQLGAGARRTRLLIIAVIFLNLWASIMFGWLFWQVGLLSAMIAHMVFHIVWYPLDQRHRVPDANNKPIANNKRTTSRKKKV